MGEKVAGWVPDIAHALELAVKSAAHDYPSRVGENRQPCPLTQWTPRPAPLPHRLNRDLVAGEARRDLGQYARLVVDAQSHVEPRRHLVAGVTGRAEYDDSPARPHPAPGYEPFDT